MVAAMQVLRARPRCRDCGADTLRRETTVKGLTAAINWVCAWCGHHSPATSYSRRRGFYATRVDKRGRRERRALREANSSHAPVSTSA